jgi:hypothetical protein
MREDLHFSIFKYCDEQSGGNIPATWRNLSEGTPKMKMASSLNHNYFSNKLQGFKTQKTITFRIILVS